MKPEWFGIRLRELREAAGLTQQQLADRVGCTWEAVSRWERGAREPGWSQVVAICAALGTDCAVFMREPTSPPATPHPGRPRKEPTEPPAPKRPVGRPRKDPGGKEPKGRRKK
jgi:transcriptional regulator with XRE-family HTH domain